MRTHATQGRRAGGPPATPRRGAGAPRPPGHAPTREASRWATDPDAHWDPRRLGIEVGDGCRRAFDPSTLGD